MFAVSLAVILALGGGCSAYGAALEPHHHAERACARYAPPDVADSAARQSCLQRALAHPPWRAGMTMWSLAVLTMLGGALFLIADRTKEGVRHGRDSLAAP